MCFFSFIQTKTKSVDDGSGKTWADHNFPWTNLRWVRGFPLGPPCLTTPEGKFSVSPSQSRIGWMVRYPHVSNLSRHIPSNGSHWIICYPHECGEPKAINLPVGDGFYQPFIPHSLGGEKSQKPFIYCNHFDLCLKEYSFIYFNEVHFDENDYWCDKPLSFTVKIPCSPKIFSASRRLPGTLRMGWDTAVARMLRTQAVISGRFQHQTCGFFRRGKSSPTQNGGWFWTRGIWAEVWSMV